MRKIFLVFALFFSTVILFAQDCDEITIDTNAQSAYTLCNGTIDIPFTISNPEQFNNVNWIIGDEYRNGSNVNFSLNQAGSYKLNIQATHTNGCLVGDEIYFQIMEGPSSDNVTANLNSSIDGNVCLETGSTHQLTTEIISSFSASSIYWYQTGETTGIDHTFDVVVGDNDVFNSVIQLEFNECEVDLLLNHPYATQYKTTFSNTYDGSTLCEGQAITLTNTSPHRNLVSNFWWEIENAEIISQNYNSITFTYDNDGTYNWQLNYNNSSCPPHAESVTVDIADASDYPVAGINSEDIESCELPYNLNVNTAGSTPVGSLSYDWKLDLGDSTITTSESEAFEYDIQNSGTYELTLEISNNTLTCTTKDTILVSVDDLNLNLDIDSLYECENYTFKPMDFAINSLDTSVTYLWEIIDADGDTLFTDTLKNPSFKIKNSGFYDLSVALSSDINEDCNTTIFLEDIIQIYPSPLELSLGILESNSCFSETVDTIKKTIYADFNTPSVLTNYTWTVHPSGGIDTTLNTSDTIKLAFTEPGNYKVTYEVRVENSDCIYFEEKSFDIGAKAQIDVSPEICLGTPFILMDAADIPNTSFSWTSSNDDLVIADSTKKMTTISTDVAGTYNIQLTVENDLGCTATDQVSIEAYEVDALFSSPNSGEQCKPAIVEFNSLNNDYIQNYTWNIHETNYLGVESDTTITTYLPNFTTLFNEIASYNVELIINSRHGCKDTMLIEDYVDVISPLPYFTLEPSVSCDTVHLDIIDSSIFIDSYTFDYGNGTTQDYVSNDTTVSYTYPYGDTLSSVDYYITLDAKYKFCTETFTDTVSVDRPVYPTAPSINYVTVFSEDRVIIEWSNESLNDDFDTIRLYESAIDQPSFIYSTGNTIPNHFQHTVSSDQVNSYTATQQDTCGNISIDPAVVHSTILVNSTTPTFETVNLSWTPYIGWDSIASYDIYRSGDSIATVHGESLSYQDTNLCNVVYDYYIVANHPEENFQSRSNKTFITPDYVEYDSPLNLISTSVLNNEHIITKWDYYSDHTSDIIGYNIDRWDDYFGWIINYDYTPQSPYIDSNVGVHRNYKYRISYEDNCGNVGPDSNIGNNIVLDGVQYANRYDLNWNSYQHWDDGVQEYIIEYNQLENTSQYITDAGTDTTYIHSNPTKNDIDTSYCYRVVAINDADQSIKSYSNTRCFIPEPKNHFPNAFSPNDDGLNETFKYEGQFAKKLNTEIYNRWGNLVYSSDEIEFEWDGENENTGEVCPQGTYIFRYELTGYDGTIIKDDMIIYLLR